MYKSGNRHRAPRSRSSNPLRDPLDQVSFMPSRLALVTLVVPDYDAAIGFFTAIGFDLLEDTVIDDKKRWVRVAPPGAETAILLARAADSQQVAAIGNQGGGRVWLFLETQDFDKDYKRLSGNGATFEEPPRLEPYGRVAVWRDPWGNRWDLIQFTA